MVRTVLGLFVCWAVVAQGLKLPNYIRPCSRKDPNLNSCAVTYANEALPTLFRGDSKYHIPSFMPLKVDEIRMDAGQLKLTLKKLNIHFPAPITMTDMDIKIVGKEKLTVKAVGHTPSLLFLSDYDVKGQILILPITGSGPANITFTNFVLKDTINAKITERKGKHFAHIENSKLSFTTDRMQFQLDNLFGGDKALSDNMNSVLNENWRELYKELHNQMSEALAVIVESVLEALFERVPLDNMFEDF